MLPAPCPRRSWSGTSRGSGPSAGFFTRRTTRPALRSSTRSAPLLSPMCTERKSALPRPAGWFAPGLCRRPPPRRKQPAPETADYLVCAPLPQAGATARTDMWAAAKRALSRSLRAYDADQDRARLGGCMVIAQSVALYLVAGLFEIGGRCLVWQTGPAPGNAQKAHRARVVLWTETSHSTAPAPLRTER